MSNIYAMKGLKELTTVKMGNSDLEKREVEMWLGFGDHAVIYEPLVLTKMASMLLRDPGINDGYGVEIAKIIEAVAEPKSGQIRIKVKVDNHPTGEKSWNDLATNGIKIPFSIGEV